MVSSTSRFPAFTVGLSLGMAVAVSPATVEAQVAVLGGSSLEEVVVTARKREETLIDIPVSVSVLSAKEIEVKGIQNLQDVARFTPGLFYFDVIQSQLGTPVIRGLTQLNRGAPDRNVAVFYGGVYLANPNASTLELLDVERIEVVKGPQSALYGRNAFNGAINYVPASPTETPFARIAATVGSDSRYEAKLLASGPLTDTLRGRIALSSNSFDGSWENAAEPGGGLGGYKTKNLSAVLDWTPSEAFSARLFGYRTEDLRDSSPAFLILANNCGPAGQPVTAYCGEIPAANTLAANPDSLAFERNSSLGSLELSYDFGPVTLKSQTAVAEVDTDNFSDNSLGVNGGRGFVFDIVNNAAPNVVLRTQNLPVFVGSGKGETRTISQELRFEGDLGARASWALGGFLYKNEFVSTTRLIYDGRGLAVGERPRADSSQFIAGGPTTRVAYSDPRNNMITLSRFEGEDKQRAFFGSFEFKPAQGWTVGGELRSDNEDRKRVNTVAGPSTSQAAEYKYTTWRAFGSFAPSESQRFYTSAAKGVISGYFNGIVDVSAGGLTIPQNLQAYDPSENITYELGWKATWLNRRLNTEVAVFFIDYKGIQIPATPPAPYVTNLVQNVGDATSKGVELSVNFAMTEKWTVGGTYSYTPTEFADGTVDGGMLRYCGGTGTAIPAAAIGFCPSRTFRGQVLPDVSGNPLPLSPEQLASLYASFETPLSAAWTFYARTDASYAAETNTQTIKLSTIPSYTLINARLGLRRGAFEVALWGRNIADKKFVAVSIFQPPVRTGAPVFIPNVTMGERATYGLTATYSFGE
jgi:iron complex outermembrane receptor protein